MAVEGDAVEQEATIASSALDLEEGTAAPSKFIPAEGLQDEDESPSSPFPGLRAPTPRRRLYMMVLADFGLSFTWLAKFAVATPYFQHTLKAGPFLSHLVWIMGPLSGLIVAPVVGVLSDRCTWSLGRRRPFILGGMLACILGMNVFANAAKITFGYLPAARLVAFLAFGVLDFSTNAIMFPSRALMGDLLPPEEQHSVQSAAAVVASLAEICAGAYMYSWKDPVTHVAKIFIVASVFLAVTCSVSLYVCHEEPLLPENILMGNRARDIEASQAGGLGDVELDDLRPEEARESNEQDSVGSDEPNGVVEDKEETGGAEPAKDETSETKRNEEERDEDVEQRLSSGVAEDRAEGPPNPEADYEAQQDVVVVVGTVWRDLVATLRSAIMNFPRPLVKVGVVYGLAWFVWFASLPFYSQWLGVDVLGGDPQAEPGSEEALRYQNGVNIFAVANVAKALLAIVFSAFYPNIIKWVGAIGERVVFGLSFFVFSSVLYALAYTNNVAIAGSIIALGAVPFIVTQTIPIALVVQRFPDNLASNLGVLNLFCVIPQLIDTIYTGKVAEYAGESAVLRVAAGWGFAAAIAAVLFLN